MRRAHLTVLHQAIPDARERLAGPAERPVRTCMRTRLGSLLGEDVDRRLPDGYLPVVGGEMTREQLDGEISAGLVGWWRITTASRWVDDGLDILGPAVLSITGQGDRLRMHCLLAHVNVRATEAGASFTWTGVWEYDPMSGSGTVELGQDGKLHGHITINDGDESDFTAERTTAPAMPIPEPPDYRDKWAPRRRWR